MQSFVIFVIRSASAFIASSVWSYDIVFDGNAHMFPIVIDPNPRALLPFLVVTRQWTFRMVTRSTTRPPNL